jgi:hypothetical protein
MSDKRVGSEDSEPSLTQYDKKWAKDTRVEEGGEQTWVVREYMRSKKEQMET